MDLYEDIRLENAEILLRSLAERTLADKQQWYKLKYSPISFMQEGENGEEAYISHILEMETEFNGREYTLELLENISFPSKKGDILGTVYFTDEEGENKYDFALSYNQRYEECCIKELKDCFLDNVVFKLAEAAIKTFEGSEAEKIGFSLARFFNQKEIKEKWKRDSLVILSKKLMNEKRLRDFHKIILDLDHRNKLIKC